MDKLKMLNRIKELYAENINIINYLKTMDNSLSNSLEDIMISYDFQAGTYIEAYKADAAFKNEFCLRLANIISQLGSYGSLMEAGIGEGTTLLPLLAYLKLPSERCLGFDISWSRIKYAKAFAKEVTLSKVKLFTGDLFCSPVKDNAIDIVYTCHSIEPNGGREREALIELYRVTNKYLILLEPSYEFAGEEARARILKHGYVTNLYATAQELGYKVIEHKLFGMNANVLNPTGLIIIEKNVNSILENDPLCCPITKASIRKQNNAYYSEKSLLAYPIIGEIPCLLPQNAIVATKFLD